MIPADLPIACVEGDDLSLSLTITEDSVAYPWSGVTVASAIYTLTGAAVAVASFTTATPTDGTLTVSLTDTQTGTLGPGTYRYAITFTEASLTRTMLAGVLSVMEAGYGGTSVSSATLSVTTGTATVAITGQVTANAAANITVADTGGYYTGTNVETVLAEIGKSSLHRLITTAKPFNQITRNATLSPGPYIIGMDTDRVFYKGLNLATIGYGWNSSGSTITWTTSTTLPAGVASSNVYNMVTFGSYHYLLAKPTSPGTSLHVYRAPVLSLGTDSAWSWSDVLDLGTDASPTGLATQLATDPSYIYVCEYGDHAGGPTLRRSSDGTTWTTLMTDADIRHHHCVATDPYNAGHVWLTSGDGIAKTIRRSTDYGSTWSTIAASSEYQAVQISFDSEYVYFAHDSAGCTFHVYDRAAGAMRVGAPNWHYNIAVPLGARTVSSTVYTPTIDSVYSINAYYGAVDPSTGIYYACANEAATNNWHGIFTCMEVGQPLTLFDRGLPSGNQLNNAVFVWKDWVFCGLWRFPRIVTA